jgi:hypothetical protein
VPPDVSYATKTAVISRFGVEAHFEDGRLRVVPWPEVVGIVARRLPLEPPYAGETFVDIVSTAGSTVRIVPWTTLVGDVVNDGSEERARAVVKVAADYAPAAQIDPATRMFLEGTGRAAQLPDAATLALHDQRLA